MAMPVPLFQQPLHNYWKMVLGAAAADVEMLPRAAFSDPALAGQLERIAAQHSIDIAELKPEAINADARKQPGWLVVTIPFTGSAQSLQLCPSRSTIVQHAVDIDRGVMTLQGIRDDDRADAAVKGFVDVVSQNLNLLRVEYQQLRPQLIQKIQEVAERRKAKIAAEDARDKGRSFRVSR